MTSPDYHDFFAIANLAMIGWLVVLWVVLLANWRWFYVIFGPAWSILISDIVVPLPASLKLHENPSAWDLVVFYSICLAPIPLLVYLAYRWLKRPPEPVPELKESP